MMRSCRVGVGESAVFKSLLGVLLGNACSSRLALTGHVDRFLEAHSQSAAGGHLLAAAAAAAASWPGRGEGGAAAPPPLAQHDAQPQPPSRSDFYLGLATQALAGGNAHAAYDRSCVV